MQAVWLRSATDKRAEQMWTGPQIFGSSDGARRKEQAMKRAKDATLGACLLCVYWRPVIPRTEG